MTYNVQSRDSQLIESRNLVTHLWSKQSTHTGFSSLTINCLPVILVSHSLHRKWPKCQLLFIAMVYSPVKISWAGIWRKQKYTIAEKNVCIHCKHVFQTVEFVRVFLLGFRVYFAANGLWRYKLVKQWSKSKYNDKQFRQQTSTEQNNLKSKLRLT